MNLNELLNSEKPKIEITPFLEVDSILQIVSKAIDLWLDKIEYWCEKCKYWIIQIQNNTTDFPYYKEVLCECRKQIGLVNNSLYNLKNIDSRELQKYNYNNYTWSKPWKEYLYNLFQNDKKWIFLYWPPWTGKTYSAYIMLYLASSDKSVFATSLQAVLEDARPNNDNQWGLYKKCETVDVLVLDDYWREKISEWVQNKLFDLLNLREKRGQLTIFTSNYSFDNLESLKDPAMKSRFEWGCLKIHLWGDDLRLNKK